MAPLPPPDGLERPEDGVGEVFPLEGASLVFEMALAAVAFAPAAGLVAGSFLASSFFLASVFAVSSLLGPVPPIDRTFAALGLVVSAPRVRTLVPPSF